MVYFLNSLLQVLTKLKKIVLLTALEMNELECKNCEFTIILLLQLNPFVSGGAFNRSNDFKNKTEMRIFVP